MSTADERQATLRLRGAGPRPAPPVIPGFFPDPSVCRVGPDHYLATSSFEYAPGVPIWHSTDLITWTQVGNALQTEDQLPLRHSHDSGGVYAPTLRHHDGRFWLVTTVVDGDAPGHRICSATDPAGPWSTPVLVPGVPGIDPDLVWDSQGTCLLTYSDSVADEPVAGIKQVPVRPETGEVLGPPVLLWQGTGMKYPEGPHLYQVDGRWYLLIAEGGTESGHAVSIARGPTPQGPFEACPDNPVLSHRSTASPVQNTGHGDLVQRADGSWALVHLGVRPLGSGAKFHVLGRETFLAEVTWRDGWPVVTGRTVAEDATATPVEHVHEDFAGPLGPAWVWVRVQDRESAHVDPTAGALRLRGPVFVGQRQRHLAFAARAAVRPGATRAGLRVRLDDRHHYDLHLEDGTARLVVTLDQIVHQHATVAVPEDAQVVLEVRSSTMTGYESGANPITRGPDLLTFGVHVRDEHRLLGTLDGRYLSSEVASGFTGRVVGLYASDGGTADVEWFDYDGSDEGL